MTVSVVISARNEFPSIVHTVHSIISDLETFLPRNGFEVIIVDNLSTDGHPEHPSFGGTVDFLRARSAYANGIIRVLYDPIAGNVSSRNKGAKIATGDYLFFSDAHVNFQPGAFRRLMAAIDASGGIAHPAIAWMGSYPPDIVYQYSWVLGDTFDGEWNASSVSTEWFYVPAMGHCCVGMRREQFLDFGGYLDSLRTYGGGGMYLDTKWWLFGASVVTEPRALVFHLSAGRTYSYAESDYIHNLFASALSLGASVWAERMYLSLRHHPECNLDALDKAWRDAAVSARDDREFVQLRSRMSFDELISKRPWDDLNRVRCGAFNSSVTIRGEWDDDAAGRSGRSSTDVPPNPIPARACTPQ